MDPRLTSLLELQRVMLLQKQAEEDFQEIPRRRQEIQDEIGKLKSDLNTILDKKKELEIEQSQCELEIKQNQEIRVKKEAQLLTIKSNKEYQATSSEIQNLDRKSSRNEERVIDILNEVEKLTSHIEEKQKALADREPALLEEDKALEDKEHGLKKKFDEAKEKTDEVASTVEPSLYRRFKIVFDNKGGQALAPANDGHCGGCSIKLTPRSMQLAMRGQDIVICEGCARFLYWDHSLEEEQFDEL